MEGPLRYRQLRNYANRRIYVFDTLGIDLTLRGIPQRRLSIAFSPSKVFGHWRRQNFGERSSTSNKERTAANTNAASAYCFEILCERNFSKGYWRFIWCWRICYMYCNSQSFKGYCETKHNSCHSQKTWLIQRESFMMLRTFQLWSGPSIVRIRIISPNKENAMAFVNRKQFYSIKVQAVCDSDAFITSIVARWPGSTHAFLRTARSQTN